MAVNGKHMKMQTPKRRSKLGEDETDYVPEPSTSKQEFQSTINQRPRRAVKHKFIKSNSSLAEDTNTQFEAPPLPLELEYTSSSPVIITLDPDDSEQALTKQSASVSPCDPLMLPETKKIESRRKKKQSEKPKRRSGRQTLVSNSSESARSNDSSIPPAEFVDISSGSVSESHMNHGGHTHLGTNQLPRNIEYDDSLSNNATDTMDSHFRPNRIKIEPATVAADFNDNNDEQYSYSVRDDGNGIIEMLDDDSEVVIEEVIDDQDQYQDVIYVEDDSDDSTSPLNDAGVEQEADESNVLQGPTSFDRFADDADDSVILITGNEDSNEISIVECSTNVETEPTEILQYIKQEIVEPMLPVKKRGRPKKNNPPTNHQEQTKIKVEKHDLQEISENFSTVTIDYDALQLRTNISNVSNSLQKFALTSGRSEEDRKTVISTAHKMPSDIKVEPIDITTSNAPTASNSYPQLIIKSEDSDSEQYLSPVKNNRFVEKLNYSAGDSDDSFREHQKCQSIRSRPRRQSIQVKNYSMSRNYRARARRPSADGLDNGTSDTDNNGVGSPPYFNSALPPPQEAGNSRSVVNIILIDDKVINAPSTPQTPNHHDVFSQNNGELTDREAAADLLLQLSESATFHHHHRYPRHQNAVNTCGVPSTSMSEEETTAVVDRLNVVASDPNTMSVKLISRDNGQEAETVIAEHPKKRGRGRPKRRRPEDGQFVDAGYVGYQDGGIDLPVTDVVVEDVQTSSVFRTTRRSTKVSDIASEVVVDNSTSDVISTVEIVPMPGITPKKEPKLEVVDPNEAEEQCPSVIEEVIIDGASENTQDFNILSDSAVDESTQESSVIDSEVSANESRNIQIFDESMCAPEMDIMECAHEVEIGADSETISSVETIKEESEEESTITFDIQIDSQNSDSSEVVKKLTSVPFASDDYTHTICFDVSNGVVCGETQGIHEEANPKQEPIESGQSGGDIEMFDGKKNVDASLEPSTGDSNKQAKKEAEEQVAAMEHKGKTFNFFINFRFNLIICSCFI